MSRFPFLDLLEKSLDLEQPELEAIAEEISSAVIVGATVEENTKIITAIFARKFEIEDDEEGFEAVVNALATAVPVPPEPKVRAPAKFAMFIKLTKATLDHDALATAEVTACVTSSATVKFGELLKKLGGLVNGDVKGPHLPIAKLAWKILSEESKEKLVDAYTE